MAGNAKMTMMGDEFHFKLDADYLDIKVNREGGQTWLELSTETTGRFCIESIAQVDMIANKLKELLKQKD